MPQTERLQKDTGATLRESRIFLDITRVFGMIRARVNERKSKS
jgi:hypothetical protein